MHDILRDILGLVDLENGTIESTTSEIKDEDGSSRVIILFFEAICDGSSSWLVDESDNVEASSSTSKLGGFTLCIVEVSGYCDNRITDTLDSREGLGDFSHFCEDLG